VAKTLSGARRLSYPHCINLDRTSRHEPMYQIKIFKGLESNLSGLEKEVNAWLAETNARVVQIFGNMAPLSGERNEGNSLAAYPYVASDVLLVVLYEKPA
jgi:hypothetical protein